MGEAFEAILIPAVGIAVSPIPIIGLIIILLSEKGRLNSLFYLLGWVLGCASAFTIAMYLGSLTIGAERTETMAMRIVLVLLGVILLLFAVREFARRPKPGMEVKTPRWLERLNKIGPIGTLLLSFALSAFNPEDMLFAVAAGVRVGALGLPSDQIFIVSIAFLVISSATIFIPTIIYLVLGDRLADVLKKSWVWLRQNNALIMSIILLFIGLSLISKAF